MRIIHNIGPRGTISLGAYGSPFRGSVGHEHEWIGWHAELWITSRDALSGVEQVIEIEGNGDDVIHALKTATAMLEAHGADLRKQFEAGVNINPPRPKITAGNT